MNVRHSIYLPPPLQRRVSSHSSTTQHYRKYKLRLRGGEECLETLGDEARLFNRGQHGEVSARERVAVLQNRELSANGDLGWSLGYATAYCYRFLNSNRFALVAAINNIRTLPLETRTPFVIFGTLDKHIFAAKLSGMVLLHWKPMGSTDSGRTCASQVSGKRICVFLNSSPFEQGEADMSGLLDALVHQMIHAYFLVCCGSQDKSDKQDGRLQDGLHFAVILSTINDVTRDCLEGSLGMKFYAADRILKYPVHHESGRGDYISLDPPGILMTQPTADSMSHCMHDNRHVTRAQVMNWQVQDYARCINEDWESRGDEVYIWLDLEHHMLKRTSGPPSKMYIELVHNNKRFAVPKAHADKYPTLKRMGGDNKYGDVKLPECTDIVFECLWKFIVAAGYDANEVDYKRFGVASSSAIAAGPPVLREPSCDKTDNTRLHIQVCKMADAMRFSELQQYALRKLYELPLSFEDPICILDDIYNAAKPLSVELQRWSRRFMARLELGASSDQRQGLSNYEKICMWHPARFKEIHDKHVSLRDDCVLVVAALRSGYNPNMDSQTTLESEVYQHVRTTPGTDRHRQQGWTHPIFKQVSY